MRSAPLWCLFALSCAHFPVGERAAAPILYSFEAEGHFRTRAADGAGQAVAGLPAGLAEASLWLRGSLSREPAREMRDGSQGHLVRFLSVEMATSAGGPFTPSELGGRSAELRTFENGEILDIYEAAHLAGAPRYGDVFDLLLFGLSPVVPALPEGQSGWRRGSFPFFAGPDRGMRTSYTLSYLNEGARDEGGLAVLALPYQGTFEGRGQDLRYGATLQSKGELTGTLGMGVEDVRVARNEVHCTRTLTARFESGATLTQEQDLRIRLLRGSAP